MDPGVNREALNFYKSPPSLEDLASASISFAIWKHHYCVLRNVRCFDACSNVEKYCYQSESHTPRRFGVHNTEYCDHLGELARRARVSISTMLPPIPAKVRRQLARTIDWIACEMYNWLHYHRKTVFPTNKCYNRYADKLIHTIVWNFDIRIDYAATARNLLARLSPTRNVSLWYRIACLYCMPDEIKMAHKTFTAQKYSKKGNFTNDPVVCYWTHYFNGQLHKIDARNQRLSLPSHMCKLIHVTNWTIIEYFFDQLSPIEQVTEAVYLIVHQGIRYQAVLLSKLNYCQQKLVFKSMATSIICNFAAADYSNAQYAIDVWDHSKVFISAEQFRYLILHLVRIINDQGDDNNQHVRSLIFEIWHSASVKMKNHFFQFCTNIFHLLYYNGFRTVGPRMEILLTILSNADIVYRQRMLQNCWQNMPKMFDVFIRHHERDCLDEFLKRICINMEEIKEFKKALIRYDENMLAACLKELVEAGKMFEFHGILADHFTEPDLSAYKLKFLKPITTMYCLFDQHTSCTSPNDKCETRKRIENILQNNERVDKFIYDLFSAPKSQVVYCKKFYEGQFDQVKFLVEHLITSDVDQRIVRRKLYEIALKSNKIIIKRYTIQFNNFMWWCSRVLRAGNSKNFIFFM